MPPFQPGQSGNPKGRPPRPVEEDYRARIKVACQPSDLEEITHKAVEQAKAGDFRARDWISKQLGTEAPSKNESKVTLGHEASEPLTQEDEAFARELAVRIYGPAVARRAEGLANETNGNGNGHGDAPKPDGSG